MRFMIHTIEELIEGKSGEEIEQLLRSFVENENTIPFDYNFRDEGPASGFGHVLSRAGQEAREKIYVPASKIATELVENYLSNKLNLEEFAKLAETFDEMFLWGSNPELVKVDRKKLFAAIRKSPDVTWPAKECGGQCAAHRTNRILDLILVSNQSNCTAKEKSELIEFWKKRRTFWGLYELEPTRVADWYELAKVWETGRSYNQYCIDRFLEKRGIDKKYNLQLVTKEAEK